MMEVPEEPRLTRTATDIVTRRGILGRDYLWVPY